VNIDINSPESRRTLAKTMIKLFDHWGIEAGDQLILLGLDADCQGIQDQFRSGEAALPETGETMERVSWLLTVHKALRIAYSYNRDLVYQWVTANNRRFGGKAPLDVMKHEGLAGIKMIAVYLESI
jgi:hypothetical protein